MGKNTKTLIRFFGKCLSKDILVGVVRFEMEKPVKLITTDRN
jgi:hypothetical protein